MARRFSTSAVGLSVIALVPHGFYQQSSQSFSSSFDDLDGAGEPVDGFGDVGRARR